MKQENKGKVDIGSGTTEQKGTRKREEKKENKQIIKNV